MKKISEIPVNTNALTENKNAPVGAEQLDDDQLNAVIYFFTRLKMLDPIQFDSVCPDTKTEKLVKREYAIFICDLTKEQIDNGFNEYHAMRQSGDPEARFLNIDKIVGLSSKKVVSGDWHHRTAAYKPVRRLGLPDGTKKEKSKAAHKRAMEEMRKGLR